MDKHSTGSPKGIITAIKNKNGENMAKSGRFVEKFARDWKI